MILFKRENYLKKIRGFYHDDDIIKVITGVRRCGKSSLMQTIVEELLDLGIHKENIIFIDLDSLENKRIKTPDALEQLIKKLSVSQEKKYYLADLGFYYALNTNNQIEYSNDLENILYIYARSRDYSISVGKIGKLECDFILRDIDLNYSYVQVAYSILQSQETLDREFKPLESVKDNYPKYIMILGYLFQNPLIKTLKACLETIWQLQLAILQ